MKFHKFKFKRVNSTNNTAIRIIKNSNFNQGMIISEFQKNGKGQYGRKWISFKGNVFVSFFYNLKNINLSTKRLTNLNCKLVKKLLSKYYKNKIVIKAPNDLLIKGKKISGILQEIIIKNNQKYIIVGVGINIIKSPYIKNYPTTNLFEITGKKINYIKLVNLLKSIFEKNFSKYYG